MTATSTPGEFRRGVFPPVQEDPFSDEYTRPFWEAAREDRLVVPRCTGCGTFRMPPLPLCFVCRSESTEWTELAGTGSVYTYTVITHPLHPGLAAVVPYISGVIELDGTQGAGARMLANIVDCDPETITIGTRVRIAFDHINDEMSVPRFRPVPDEEK